MMVSARFALLVAQDSDSISCRPVGPEADPTSLGMTAGCEGAGKTQSAEDTGRCTVTTDGDDVHADGRDTCDKECWLKYWYIELTCI
ncbi:hypothetical protein P152DRAFT_461690 [Eremomyces bilateralis CBS 781.70]|uniref:Uncharacterized protein n=1 Tax=Eremomyces bilateralis CBS 781.70 TaxID=1392243 RepID=A0A6G1FUE3_9PEZI|nr:uncharacterized protein P152DRAFT_461690 [Eremomyces bilateralis CBS 781.70]KAF1809271.1 hypothetical protein P152DRAFT_461690 [Eremomyces bilateralis CBS 781.70]